MIKKIYLALGGLALALTVAAAVYLVLGVLAPPAVKPGLAINKPDVTNVFPVHAGEAVQEEREYLCGDVQVVFLGRAPADMVGLDREALERRYPSAQGWSIAAQGSLLVLKQHINDFCPEHQDYRHLGISQGMLAVYQGPLGCNQKLLRVENKLPLSGLSPDLQVKLEQAMDFDRQDVQTQGALRAELEFVGDQALNAMLDNLDEASSMTQSNSF
ncbi:hypothetical protein [Desulfotomaculum copahuensis]|uniref:Bypass of forespore C C-terminal domain-containing protein n=1 Tax=Desulfotomaculum copahuensis TaxID=1838280 RepID=A0A1B7LHR0_9FIRM|nr:hypothetical protein [Desulfotomaculum copahuensis]OAT85733.1 hypothetical protein A6M21_04330 [Desulfotomaculum copahuensis]